MDLRVAASEHDKLLEQRLGSIVPDLMRRHGFEAWVIVAREYNEDPVAGHDAPRYLALDRAPKDHPRLQGLGSEPGRRRPLSGRAVPFGLGSGIEARPVVCPRHIPRRRERPDRESTPPSVSHSPTGSAPPSPTPCAKTLAGHELAPADPLAIGWLETRLPEEVRTMSEACRDRPRVPGAGPLDGGDPPGVTTTQDVAWWLAQATHDSGARKLVPPGGDRAASR